MTDDLAQKAVNATFAADQAYCKFLSANDTGETGGHQSGILIGNSAKTMMFSDEEIHAERIPKKSVRIKWQDDFYTDGCFTWYESKTEFRLTKFGRGFPFLIPEYTGALFILTKMSPLEYEGFFLNTEEEINQYLETFGLTPLETNRLIETDYLNPVTSEKQVMSEFINSFSGEFPTSEEMSSAARQIYYRSKLYSMAQKHPKERQNPDKILIEWTDEEFRLFRAIEQAQYGGLVSKGFPSVDKFIDLANTVLNRRKSRAGKSLEHHLAAIFDENSIKYTAQGITEGKKKPDFIFPSVEAYHDTLFSVEKLCTLAAKTTCKDRWRQVLTEADRLRDRNKYLCTLQQGISATQLDEMQSEKVVLVVPKPYISTYPKEYQKDIWTVADFVAYVKGLEK